jgi:hypothetical protein
LTGTGVAPNRYPSPRLGPLGSALPGAGPGTVRNFHCVFMRGLRAMGLCFTSDGCHAYRSRSSIAPAHVMSACVGQRLYITGTFQVLSSFNVFDINLEPVTLPVQTHDKACRVAKTWESSSYQHHWSFQIEIVSLSRSAVEWHGLILLVDFHHACTMYGETSLNSMNWVVDDFCSCSTGGLSVNVRRPQWPAQQKLKK